jgi:outer membrane protein assembly factor BamB
MAGNFMQATIGKIGIKGWMLVTALCIIVAAAGGVGVVTFITHNQHQEQLITYDANTGKEQWHLNTTSGHLVAANQQEVVFLTSPAVNRWGQSGILNVYNANNGDKLWQSKTPITFLAASSSVILSTSDQHTLQGMDAYTGTTLWSYGSLPRDAQNIVVSSDGVYFVNEDDTTIVALSLLSGKVLWQTQIPSTSGVSIWQLDAGLLYISAQSLYALNIATGQTSWQNPGILIQAQGDYAVVEESDWQFAIVNTRSGQQWTFQGDESCFYFEVERDRTASVTIQYLSGNQVYIPCLSSDGNDTVVTAFNANSGHSLGKITLSGTDPRNTDVAIYDQVTISQDSNGNLVGASVNPQQHRWTIPFEGLFLGRIQSNTYVLDDQGIQAISIKDGKTVWSTKEPGPGVLYNFLLVG